MSIEENTDQQIEELSQELLALEVIRKRVISPFFERYRKVSEILHELKGDNNPFMVEGVAMKFVPKKGTYVDFTPYELARTRVIEGTKDKNSYTVKEAKEAGFEPTVPSTSDVESLVFLATLLQSLEEDNEQK